MEPTVEPLWCLQYSDRIAGTTVVQLSAPFASLTQTPQTPPPTQPPPTQ